MTKLLLILFGLSAACGGSSDTPVADLSVAAQESLCEDFVDSICDDPDFAGFCDDPCVATACPDAAADGAIAAQCDLGEDGEPITDGDVTECGDTGDLAVCLNGGGCMFDAVEETCSEELVGQLRARLAARR
jgi:hypothetical protein